jgi:hypothetical protein
MFFLVSIASEVFDRMMRVRVLYRRLGIEASVTRDAPRLLRDVRDSFGGRFVLLDWLNAQVLADIPFAGAAGFAINGDTIMACSWTQQSVHVLRGRETLSSISHRWFNYLHSLDVVANGNYLLASAGSDLIVEVTPRGEVVWDWFGPEHGYDRQPCGKPAFCDRDADYRTLPRSSDEQAMHVNCAIQRDERTVLATLFHQGQLIAIDRVTGGATVKLRGLSRPHGIHRRPGGFLLSNTLGHRIVLLTDDLEVFSEIPCGSQWLQDTIATGAETFLTLENVHIDQLPEPGLTNRIAEIDPAGRTLRSLSVGADCRLFTVREVSEPFARSLARAWGCSGELAGWKWN